MSRAVVGGFFTQGSYNELRKFVINYIHTIAFEGNQEERAYDICMRSKSIQGWKINRYLFFLEVNPEKTLSNGKWWHGNNRKSIRKDRLALLNFPLEDIRSF